jgi:anti-sigma B factor antagonist
MRGDVAVVAVTESRFTDEDNIEVLGRELFALSDQFSLRRIVLTLDNVQLVTSAVLGKVISLHRRLHRISGTLVLCGLNPSVANAIRASRLSTYFHIEPDLETAIRAVE